MGRIQDQTRVEGVFPKHTNFVQCPMEKKYGGIGDCTQKVRIKFIVLYVSFLVELELLTHALWWGTITGSVFQKRCSTMKPVVIT